MGHIYYGTRAPEAASNTVFISGRIYYGTRAPEAAGNTVFIMGRIYYGTRALVAAGNSVFITGPARSMQLATLYLVWAVFITAVLHVDV